MKYLITGLGNIGEEYKNTRHNIGFKILDALADASNIVFKQERYGSIAKYKYKGQIFILLKPNTYVNLSGKAVNYWLQNEKIQLSNSLIISDDLALPFGQIKIKPKGGDAGHNGLKSIIETLGHQNFTRLKFGIGNEFLKGKQVDYVLGKWDFEEEKGLSKNIETCIEVIKSFGTIGLSRTMNQFNTLSSE
jgi:PTH1 family peptidyl-tRNA hydrolase